MTSVLPIFDAGLVLERSSQPSAVVAPRPSATAQAAEAGWGLDVVRDEAGFAALQPVWDGLVDQMALSTPFLRWDWVRRWWADFGRGKSLAIGVLRDASGSPLAIAPCVLTIGHRPVRCWLRHLTWLGGMGWVLGERMDLIIPAGREAEMAPPLLRFIDLLQAEWQAVWLPAVPSDSPNLPHYREALDRAGTNADVADVQPCRFTTLPADMKTLEAPRSSRWRRNLRNRWSTFLDKHEGSRGISGVDLPHDEAFDHLARLHRLHWPDGVSNFVRKDTWPFHRSMALDWLETGRAMLSFLKAGDQVVAATYGLVDGGRFSLFQQGWDPALKHLSIGNLAVHWSIETAIARGLHTYDTLTGDCRYKAEWCPQLSHTLDLETFHPEVLRAHAFRVMRHVRRAFMRCFFPRPVPDVSCEGLE